MTREERNSVIDEFANALKNTKLECEQLHKDTVNALQMILPLIANDIAESLKSKIVTENVATNGDMIKAMFPSSKDWKARMEDNDGEVYEVHFVQLPNSITVNKYEEAWWNAPYQSEVSE